MTTTFTYLLPVCAPNVTHLTLFLPPSALNRLKVVKGQLTQLVFAVIVNTAEDGTEEGVFDYNVFGSCAHLQILHAANFDTVSDILAPQSVKELFLRHHSIYQLGPQTKDRHFSSAVTLAYLTGLPGVQDVSIDISGEQVPGAGQMVQLPNLTRLAIYAHYDIGAQGFLDHITTRHLTTLHLGYITPSPTNNPTNFFTAFNDLIVRSKCFLQSLTLELTAEPEFIILVRTFVKLGMLEHLIVRTRGPSQMLSHFGMLGTQKELPGRTLPIILPMLKTLSLEAPEHKKSNLPLLATWIHMRKRMSQIDRVDIVSKAEPGSRFTDAYKQAVEEFVEGFSGMDGTTVRCQFVD